MVNCISRYLKGTSIVGLVYKDDPGPNGDTGCYYHCMIV